MEYLIFFSMIAGVLAALALLCLVVFVMIIKELFQKKYKDVSYKDAVTTLCLALVFGFMAFGVIWSTVDAQKTEVQCELKGGIVNESNDCVLETPL